MKIEDDPLWQAYLKAGFKQWQSTSTAKLKGTPYFLQKRITKGRDTLFFITVYVYDCRDNIGFQPEANFNSHGGYPCFQVTYNAKGTPVQVERFFRRLYRAMNCKPYEKGEL